MRMMQNDIQFDVDSTAIDTLHANTWNLFQTITVTSCFYGNKLIHATKEESSQTRTHLVLIPPDLETELYSNDLTNKSWPVIQTGFWSPCWNLDVVFSGFLWKRKCSITFNTPLVKPAITNNFYEILWCFCIFILQVRYKSFDSLW